MCEIEQLAGALAPDQKADVGRSAARPATASHKLRKSKRPMARSANATRSSNGSRQVALIR